MALDQAVTLAVGVGCRRSCAPATIAALVVQALHGFDTTGARLFTLDRKAGEANLREAAQQLGLPLVAVPAEDLRAVARATTVRSERVSAAVGVPSVAEAAALAGAGPGARLVVTRLVRNGATCAVAVGQGSAA